MRVEDKLVEQERLRASVEQELRKALEQASGLESLQYEAQVWKRIVCKSLTIPVEETTGDTFGGRGDVRSRGGE